MYFNGILVTRRRIIHDFLLRRVERINGNSVTLYMTLVVCHDRRKGSRRFVNVHLKLERFMKTQSISWFNNKRTPLGDGDLLKR